MSCDVGEVTERLENEQKFNRLCNTLHKDFFAVRLSVGAALEACPHSIDCFLRDAWPIKRFSFTEASCGQ